MSAVSIGVAKDGQLRVGVRALSWACVATDLHRVSWAGAPGHLWALPRRALHGASGAWCLPQRPHGSTWLKTSMNIDGFPMFSPPFPFIFLYFPIIQPLEELLDEFDEFGDPPVHTHPVLKLRPKYPCLRCQRAFRGAAWVWEPHWDDLEVDMARTWLKVLKAILCSYLYQSCIIGFADPMWQKNGSLCTISCLQGCGRLGVCPKSEELSAVPSGHDWTGAQDKEPANLRFCAFGGMASGQWYCMTSGVWAKFWPAADVLLDGLGSVQLDSP